MAKVETITQDTTITINPNSKSKTYQYGAEGITLKFDGGFISDKGKEIYDYEDRYNNFAIRKKDDLVLTTLFTKDNGKIKKVTTTIKNFFADDSKNYMLNYKTYADYERYFDVTVAHWLSSPIKPNTEQGSGGLYAESGVETGPSYYLGSTKNDNVEFTTDYSEYSYDTKGNDTYSDNVANAKKYAWDMAGNDTYSVHNGGNLYVSDYKGNDIYGAGDDYSRIIVVDYSGKDDYRINAGSKFDLHDYAGNDIYSVYKNTVGDLPYIGTIADDKGNDRYVVDQATLRINDTGGKDKYEVNNTATLEISDSGKGNDTVVVKDCTGLEYDNFLISNANGNETYTLDKLKFTFNSFDNMIDKTGNYEPTKFAIVDESGNDKYTLNANEYVTIHDKKGNDKYYLNENSAYCWFSDDGGNDSYNFKGNEELYNESVRVFENGKGKDVYNADYINSINIYDDGGKNKFKIKNSIMVIINTDGNYKDTYNLSNVEAYSIVDNGGNSDTYNLVNSSGGWITEYGGNDSYTISEYAQKSRMTIEDKGGTKDKLTLKDMSKNDIVFMANVNNSGYVDNSVILFNKTNGSYIAIKDFFERATDGYISGFGDGNIETMKAGKKSLSVDYNYMNQIREEVSTFLSEDLSVMTVLDNQDTYAGTLQNLITCFTKE